MVVDTQSKDQDMVFDLQPLDKILQKYKGEHGVLIPVLQEAQAVYGYLPERVLEEISRQLDIPLARIYGVATFYAQFRLTPMGKHVVRVCTGTACHVAGAERLSDTLQDLMGVAPGETTDDGLFTLETVACLGCCSLAPVIMIDDETFGRLNDKAVRRIIGDFRRQASQS